MASRVQRTDRSLTLYPSLMMSILSYGLAAMAVAAFVRAASTNGTPIDLLGLAGGVVVFGGIATWLLVSERPVLEIDNRGMRAPFMSQYETAGWGRVALCRKGLAYAQDSFDVFYWVDHKDHSRGTELGLHIPSLLLPMKVDKILREVDRIREAAIRDR